MFMCLCNLPHKTYLCMSTYGSESIVIYTPTMPDKYCRSENICPTKILSYKRDEDLLSTLHR